MSRLPNGSGSVYRSKDAARRRPWCAVVVVGWSPRGTPIRVSRWFTTRREAEAARARMAAAINETGRLPDDRMTVSTYLDAWLGGRATDLRESSMRTYRHAVAHLDALIGWQKIAKLRPTTIEVALREMPPQTARLARGVLSAALRDAERDGLIARNPVALTRGIAVRPREQRVPTVAEVRKLLRNSTPGVGLRERSCIVVLVTTGLRAGELCGLRWEDVDGDPLTVRGQLALRDGEWQYAEPKTAAAYRTIALAPVAADALRRWRSESGRIRGYVWPGLTPKALPRVLRRACLEAGIEPFPPHSARRFVATVLAGDPKVAAMTLGHSSAAMSLDVYARGTDEMRERAAGMLQEVVG